MAATATDVKQLTPIQEGLAQNGLLPAEQLAGSSYVCGRTARGRSMIHIDFSVDDCTPCPSWSSGTRAKDLPRTLTLQPKEEHEAIQFARKRKKTEDFASNYSQRAGIEGTVSQGGRAFGLRQARYRGLKKIHLQELATAAAVNVERIANWLNGIPIALTRRSRLAALAPAG
jgi:transposase